MFLTSALGLLTGDHLVLLAIALWLLPDWLEKWKRLRGTRPRTRSSSGQVGPAINRREPAPEAVDGHEKWLSRANEDQPP